MAGMAVGYNVKKANEVMKNIKDAYEKLGIYTEQQWQGVYKTLQKQWVGEDEQDFETKLAERICTLYENAYTLANGSIQTIANLVTAWYEFQQKNTLTGDASKGNAGGLFGIGGNKFGLENVSVKAPSGSIVTPHLVTLGPDTNRGLTSTTSANTIKSAVDTFVSQIKSKTDGLFQAIQTSNAFFGDQNKAIKSYIEKCGQAIGEVTVAVKDMYNALDTLAGSSYNTASSDISQEFKTASTNVESSLNDLGSSRWS